MSGFGSVLPPANLLQEFFPTMEVATNSITSTTTLFPILPTQAQVSYYKRIGDTVTFHVYVQNPTAPAATSGSFRIEGPLPPPRITPGQVATASQPGIVYLVQDATAPIGLATSAFPAAKLYPSGDLELGSSLGGVYAPLAPSAWATQGGFVISVDGTYIAK